MQPGTGETRSNLSDGSRETPLTDLDDMPLYACARQGVQARDKRFAVDSNSAAVDESPSLTCGGRKTEGDEETRQVHLFFKLHRH